MYHIATGKDFGVGGLKGIVVVDDDSAKMVCGDIEVGEPWRRTGFKSKGNDDGISRDDFFGAGDDFWNTPPFIVGSA